MTNFLAGLFLGGIAMWYSLVRPLREMNSETLAGKKYYMDRCDEITRMVIESQETNGRLLERKNNSTPKNTQGHILH